MASSYAALVSLVNLLNQVQNPVCPASFEKLQIQSLSDKVNSLVDFLEVYSQRLTGDLTRKLVDAAFAAEDTIESYITDQILEISPCGAYPILCHDLEKSIQEMDLIIKEAMQVKKKNGEEDQLIRSHSLVDSSVPLSVTDKMVGFEDELTSLMGELTARQSSRKIIPVVGMGGIGKTTLAKNVYKHPHFKNHFDVKGWVTISQQYTVGNIIRPLLRDIGVDDVDEIDDKELGDQLYKYLYGRKYLLVLDDIWDSQAWDEINRFCPDNNNGSRILLTTRILNVANTAGSCNPFQLKLLNDDKSWDLLSKTVFGNEAYPPGLEECGKKISENCKGLPLTITVIGGLLKTSEKTLMYWEEVADNISSLISGKDGDNCLKILSLSYSQLPIHLKPCFLYFANFPEDHEIRVSELIKLWAADGFLNPNWGDTLEEVALKHLKDLVDRNLIMIKRLDPMGEMKCLTVHDFVMELCTREAIKERFLHVDFGNEEILETNNPRRLALFGSGYPSLQPKGLFRSYFSFIRNTDSPSRVSQLSLLRVCVLAGFYGVEDFMQLVNLRLLKVAFDGYYLRLFCQKNLLWNLETLIVRVPQYKNIHLPPEIWNLRRIKHLIFSEDVMLPNPPTPNADFAFQDLKTLKNVQVLSPEVLYRFPNVERMDISYAHHEGAEPLSHGFGNLAHCHKLERLKIGFYYRHVETIKFPNSLRKLTIGYGDLPWQSYHVGSLPNLKELRLQSVPFDDGKWNTIEGEFQSLRILSIEECNLKTWTVEDCYHFPTLEHLRLKSEWKLEEIPEVFGESMTLESIKLEDCSNSAAISARQILDVQQSQGNHDLTLHIVELPDNEYTRMFKALRERSEREDLSE